MAAKILPGILISDKISGKDFGCHNLGQEGGERVW